MFIELEGIGMRTLTLKIDDDLYAVIQTIKMAQVARMAAKGIPDAAVVLGDADVVRSCVVGMAASYEIADEAAGRRDPPKVN